ncbi:lamin tail domain-containing protein [Verrucomicrobiaceae bacterium 227]
MRALIPAAQAKVWLLEISAVNDGAFLDEDGDSSDWIELFNDGSALVDLSGWALSDEVGDSGKWVFPPGSEIGAGQRLMVFASGKNRRVAGGEFHTNFSLSKGGEYLGLVQANGVTVEHSLSPFPAQFEGATYGISQAGNLVTVLEFGASGQAGVPLSAADFSANYVDWNNAPETVFPEGGGSSWLSVRSGVGFENPSGFIDLIHPEGDLRAQMEDTNASVFLRLPFTVDNPGAVESMTLRMKWDDGFVAYVNGVKVAADREDDPLVWNSDADGSRSDSLNDSWESFVVDLSAVTLNAGANVLAIHGMNTSPGSSDILILPELEMSVLGAIVDAPGYLLAPTPDGVNGHTAPAVPSIFQSAVEEADRPDGGVGSAPIVVTAEAEGGTSELDGITLFYRTMYESEVQVTMKDDGLSGDLLAGDGVYGASIPTSGLSPGEMIRWRYEAEDVEGGKSTWPSFGDPVDADQYFGTVAVNAAHASSKLPIFESFFVAGG